MNIIIPPTIAITGRGNSFSVGFCLLSIGFTTTMGGRVVVVACVGVACGVLSPSKESRNNVGVFFGAEDVGLGSITESDDAELVD